MKKGKKGFVVSAVLYPLLVLFLAIIMGLLSMTDTRKRILDKMKLEITDNIFDDAACSCDTILAKLNYIIANGTGGSGGDTGSYAYNKLTLNVKTYEAYSDFPVVGNIIGDIAVLSTTPIKNYYVSTSVPKSPQEGTVWIVQDNTSNYYVTSDWNRIGISYVMQYENSKWVLKKAYVYNGESWTMLYYVNLKNGYVDITGTDINAEITKTYDYTGEYQTFKAVFSGYYKIELWGAQGGIANSTYGNGGRGAYTSGELYLEAGETIYIYVGGTTTSITGGWNGGGNGYNGNKTGRGGGGATDIRLVSTTSKNVWNEFESLKSRIMVAAGGGGASYYDTSFTSHGGSGGTLIGNNGMGTWQDFYGTGGTQSAGGYLYTSTHFTVAGDFGIGATGGTHGNGSGGGGGGYYGGGGGNGIGGGGGGSSYISGYEGCSSINEESTSTNIIHTGSAYHYSNYYFRNAKMLGGTSALVPTYDDKSTMTGNLSNGHAKITLTTIEVKTSRDKSDDATQFSYYFSSSTTAGRYQTFTAPVNGTYKVELWGAGGGSINSTYGNGGAGAYTAGNIYLTKGTMLYVYVGEIAMNTTIGGWNGGGDGYNGNKTGRGGGGATDVRLTSTASTNVWNEFNSLKSRIMVAAGGGGASYYDTSFTSHGGSGGTFIGNNGVGTWNSFYGTGATQSAGGYSYTNPKILYGGFGIGATSGTHGNGSGGGGGGYYGGGGGNGIGGGGGGSSYVSGYEGCSSVDESSLEDKIIHTGDAYHYSNYFFENITMSLSNNRDNGKAIIKLVDSTSTSPSKSLKKYIYYYSGNGKINGRYQIFDAPKTGTYKIELWGAQGGIANSSYGNGGSGAYTSGEVKLTAGNRIYVYVGSSPGNFILEGGWNGGGNGYNGSYTARGGGGATDIRTKLTSGVNLWNEPDSLRTRIMVAAGGGGGSYYNTSFTSHGGSAGGLIGNNGMGTWNSFYGTGGTQTVGGHLYTSSTTTVGQFGYGSIGGSHGNSSGGGGAGWYGGGGGNGIGGGGGGSSYISGHAGCIGVNSSGKSLTSTYSKLADSISYTGYSFTNTSMIDGTGYPWTTVKSSSSSGMPSPTSASLITGNTGDGYAKITYLGS